MDQRIRPLVDRVWRYHQLNQPLSKSDVIVVLCSHDVIVAERGAQLFLDGWAPLIVFSGGLGVITRHLWHDPEAERFAEIAVRMGVPRDRILIENKRAVGVELVDGQRITAGKVVLSAGSLHSPKILMHSGIGPGERQQDEADIEALPVRHTG